MNIKKDRVKVYGTIASGRSLGKTEAMRIVARMMQETPNPLEDILDELVTTGSVMTTIAEDTLNELVRDSEEPTSGTDTKS